MSDWLKSVFKTVLKTGLKLAETILKPIISKYFDLKEIKEIVNDPILDKDEKTNEIRKVIYGSKDNFKPYKFTSTFNSNYVQYRSSDIINERKNKDEWNTN